MQQTRGQFVQTDSDHISVCICTYKRPHLLKILLNKLQTQITEGVFVYSVTVVDNDYTQSARDVVVFCKENSIIDMDYYCEPEQNISLTRNKAIKNASGNLLAFIDDDEVPVNNWLFNLYKTLNKYKADGVLGPVEPSFEVKPPEWILKAKLFERKSFETGTMFKKPKGTRTGNVLLNKTIFDNEDNLFDSDYGRTGGEDVDFFKRMIEKGFTFVWCEEAPVYETVPPERFKRTYFLKRGLLRGIVNSKNPSFNSVIKSYIAFLIYTVPLPFFALVNQALFMKWLIRDCNHIGNLLGVCGLKTIKERDEFKSNR